MCEARTNSTASMVSIFKKYCIWISTGTNDGHHSRICARLTLHSAPHQPSASGNFSLHGSGDWEQNSDIEGDLYETFETFERLLIDTKRNMLRTCYWHVRKFPLTPMGVLPTESAYARPSTRPPIDTRGNFLVHLSAESPSNISPNPSEVIFEV